MALFVLTQRVVFSATLGALTIIIWWLLSDYYLVQLLPDWYLRWVAPACADLLATLIPSTLLLAFFAWITKRQIREGICDEIEVVPRQNSDLPGHDGLRAMLLWTMPQCRGVAQRYVSWLQGNLAGPRPWLQASWILVLGLFLGLPSAHSYLMEQIASFFSRTPPYLCCLPHEVLRAPDKIFNVRNRVPDFDGRKSLTYRLDQRTSLRDWYMPPEAREANVVKESGSLLIYAGDFPHLHRRIHVSCSLPDCGFPGLPSKTEALLPVRAGEANLEFVQSPRGIHLNVDLVLLTHSGRRLDWAFVEPKVDRTETR